MSSIVTVEKQHLEASQSMTQDDVKQVSANADANNSDDALNDKKQITKKQSNDDDYDDNDNCVNAKKLSQHQINVKTTTTAGSSSMNHSGTSSPPPRTLSLIPLRSAALSKNNKQQKQQPLEAKQFPIVLGRTNLSQWWYQSCDCQQYYCRLHCRPVAQNIGSLSKVMIQVDSAGVAHIVGKNPHLVTILSQGRSNNNAITSNTATNNNESNNINNDSNNNICNNEIIDCNYKQEENNDGYQQIPLRPRDILSIGRRDREPWMRFQVVENMTVATNAATFKTNKSNEKRNNFDADAVEKNHCPDSKPNGDQVDINSGDRNDGGGIKTQEVPVASSRPSPPSTQNEQHDATIGMLGQTTKTQTETSRNENAEGAPIATNTNNTAATQQRSYNRDFQLPEWITTTTNKTNTGRRSKVSSSAYYNDYGFTDTKQQQQHQDMVATLTKAAAAAGAAADADQRNKMKRQYRQGNGNNGSYYEYYHNSNYEADSSAAQRKRRRHTTTSFAPYHCNPSYNNKSVIRSAEDLFHNGSSRRGGRIHLVVQDYETSARLVEATRRGRKSDRSAAAVATKTTTTTTTTKTTETETCQSKSASTGVHDRSKKINDRFSQRKARSDRNFIGKPNNNEGTIHNNPGAVQN